MPVRDNLGLLNQPKGQGFSKKRMELFRRIIETIQVIYEEGFGESGVDPEDAMFVFIPEGADRAKTFEKAIEHYAIPNGICIVEDLETDGYIWIRTPEEYGEYIKSASGVINILEESKRMATAAWMNGRNLEK
jgi:hypothetical protein